ncbi:MAG: ABC transporter ATP-binding protein [Propionibacteriaceae bacterium]|jgi:putative ABC transport system ATP-binding protein|nr:ABC transporter ATP-binding protein [Propionibacteriaceae bacterium]
MDQPSLGDVRLAGQSITGRSESDLARFRRRHAGFVFQQIYLLDNMSLLDNALAAGRLLTTDRKAIAAKANGLFDRVKIGPDTRLKFPAQVSGGEAQRAGIVRALINDPVVLFADEPTGALDQSSGTAVLDVLTEVNRTGQSIVMVTHDLKSARRGNRVLFLRDGQITGDLALAPYESDADQARNDTLRSYLIEMGW